MQDNIKRTEMSAGEMVQMNRTLSTSQFKRLSVLILSKGEASLGLFTISECEKKKKKKKIFHLVCRVKSGKQCEISNIFKSKSKGTNIRSRLPAPTGNLVLRLSGSAGKFH